MEDTLQLGLVAESEGVGCDILGAVGLGAYSGIAEAAAGSSCEGWYAEQCATWREIYSALNTMSI